MIEAGRIHELLESAGKLALSHFLNAPPQRKRDLTYVTEADLEVQDFLVSALGRLFPGDGVIAEENNVRKDPASGDRYWTIDPIDGTAPFVAGLSTWSIGLGLLESGSPVCGFVYAPMTREFFHVAEEGGVFRNGRLCRMRTGDGIGRDTVLFAHSRLHQVLRLRPGYAGKVFVLGSACLQMSLVATGAADALLVGHDKIWDLAPGLAMLRRNGGTLKYLGGSEVCMGDLLSADPAPFPMLAGRASIIERMESFVEYGSRRIPV